MPDSPRTAEPFFESAPAAKVGARRLLLVSYHFPPDASVGALRWEMMLRYAAEKGWVADVLMTDLADATTIDRSRLDNLPPGTRLFGVKLPREPLITVWQFRQRLLPRRKVESASSLTLEEPPDRPASVLEDRVSRAKRNVLARSYYWAWRRWAHAAARRGIALTATTKYQCIVSSGPPHMAHEAARRIAVAASIPLITDFRDPWTSEDAALPSVNGSAWRTLSNKYERLALEASSLIVVNTNSAARLTTAKYPHLAGKVVTIMNGADGEPAVPSARALPFTIAYAGTLYGGRYPLPLFRALKKAAQARELTGDEMRLHFIGVEEAQRELLMKMASSEGIESYFTCDTWRPRSEALALLDRASVVVLLPQVHLHSIPAKLFEYVQRSVGILVLSEPGTAVAELLTGTAADVVAPDNIDAIAQVIVRRYDESRQGRWPVPLNERGVFSRERQAELLLSALDKLTVERMPG